jgi:hypothetical protein
MLTEVFKTEGPRRPPRDLEPRLRGGVPPPPRACLQARELLLARGELLALEQAPNHRSKLLLRQRCKLHQARVQPLELALRDRVAPQRAPPHEGAAANGEESQRREDLRRRAHANHVRSLRHSAAHGYGGLRGVSVAGLTQPVRAGLRAPLIWGLAIGAAQAATPLAFWWLDTAIGLTVIASVYIGFAVADGRPIVLAVESGVASMFVIIAAAAITGTPWLLVAGLAGHGFKDLWQHRRQFVANTRWWPPFCLWLIGRSQRSSPSRSSPACISTPSDLA